MTDDRMTDLEITRATTVGQLMDWRDQLDAAFAERLGKEPDCGFSVEIKPFTPDLVVICGGYESFAGECGAVVTSTERKSATPREAFEYAMQKIREYKVVTKGDKLKALRDQIAALEAGDDKGGR